MAQLERLKEERARGGKNKVKAPKQGVGGSLVSFNPDDKQKKLIKEANIGLSDVLIFFQAVLQDGHKLSMQYQQKYDAYSVILRDGGEHWDRAAAISVWHHDLEMAWRVLHFALTVVYPDFPAGVVVTRYTALDW